MSLPKRNTLKENYAFIKCPFKSKEEFEIEYKKFYHKKAKVKDLYIQILTNLGKILTEDSVDDLKNINTLISNITSVENQDLLQEYYDNVQNPIACSNLIILVCKHKKVKFLDYLFGDDSTLLNNLSVDIGKTIILPSDEDKTNHNAFYYAIRSGDVTLLNTLIHKWPNNYFELHSEELENILSKEYETLKLNNVNLSKEIQFFVENKLIDFRFFSGNTGKVKNIETSLNDIKQRIELVLQNINLLISNQGDVDEKFLYITKFIVQNLHVLKRQLKSSYARLPWEEIEFCLICFVSIHVKKEDNLIYHSVLSKHSVLNHLKNFSEQLKVEKDNTEDLCKLAELPKISRESVIVQIINNCPQFETLYNDFQEIMDIYSLKKICDNIELAVSADLTKQEGKLIIARVLQVLGEYLKNTLESPKLSKKTNDILLLSLSTNSRKAIIDLRNSLSHHHSLLKRIEVEEMMDNNFFIGVQNDTKKLRSVIIDILYKNKINAIIFFLQKIISSENHNEIKNVFEVFETVKLEENLGNVLLEEHKKLQKLIEELSNNITDKTDYEQTLLTEIRNILKLEKNKAGDASTNYGFGFTLLRSFILSLSNIKIDNYIIKVLKFNANKILKFIMTKTNSYKIKDIGYLSADIVRSISESREENNIDEIMRITYEIICITEFETTNIKWIEELREKLQIKRSSFKLPLKERNIYKENEEYNRKLLTKKLSLLKDSLHQNGLSNKIVESYTSYKNNKQLQAMIEMHVLDIMSILGSSKRCFENNGLFIDDYSPLLTGRCLRNHLAHTNALIDLLISDPTMAIILNAKKLAAENIIMTDKIRIGKPLRQNLLKLKSRYNEGLVTIRNKEKLFAVLVNGNMKSLKNCLKTGADVKARSINNWSTLHFAAKGPSLQVFEYVLNENLQAITKNNENQSPLHVAAAYGRKNIVEFLLEKTKMFVNDTDSRGRTPLHIAAQNGHKDTVEVLLKNKAETNIRDVQGFTSLHYAIENNHVDVTMTLFKNDGNEVNNRTLSGCTPLHLAAERGYLEQVNFFLQSKLNVNAKNHRKATPLHLAALNGHQDVVNVLVLKGAEVNARVADGCSPLHYAVEHGHEEVVNTLLNHGVNVNIADKVNNITPLHYASKFGYERIVRALLENNGTANVATVNGMTPLHFASENNHKGIVNMLLQQGTGVHVKSKDHLTPLHVAALSGHKEIVHLLIQNKANVNAGDIKGYMPLHLAAMCNNTDVVELLITAKAQVNTKGNDGFTPLHFAVGTGNIGVIEILIKNKAKVNCKSSNGLTPLHIASVYSKEAVNFLIRHKAEVNIKDIEGNTPLHLVVMSSYNQLFPCRELQKNSIADVTINAKTGKHNSKEIIRLLIENGADINAKNNFKKTPLWFGITTNRKDIVEILIKYGAKFNTEFYELLFSAIYLGHKDIVDIFLQDKNCTNVRKMSDNSTPLHAATSRGQKEIATTLISKGATIDARTINGDTSLHFAAKKGHEGIAEILIAKKANVNCRCSEGMTPLHVAAGHGHNNIVTSLLRNCAKVNVKDNMNRLPIELATSYGHFNVVKTLLEHAKININNRGNDGFTMLHIAAQAGSLDITKYLVENGADINARNNSNSKPIHIAAREGHINIIEYFLSVGQSITDVGTNMQTLLHYTALEGQLKTAQYLVKQGSDVNSKDLTGLTILHIAANFGHTDIITFLLNNGAIYNSVDKFGRTPLTVAKNESAYYILTSIHKLFEAVKHCDILNIPSFSKIGVSANCKNNNYLTPLHIASWKGFYRIVNMLLENGANPNAADDKGYTPLHYATKYSHLKIIKALLSNGAVYNADGHSGRTPKDFATDNNIINLFEIISECFKKTETDNHSAIEDLKNITDIDTVKAIMNACDKQNKSILIHAINKDYKDIEQLKLIGLPDDISCDIIKGGQLYVQEKYTEASQIYMSVLNRVKEISNPDNINVLDIEGKIAEIMYQQQNYQEALNKFKEICHKQKIIFGENSKIVLNTRSTMALILHRQGKNQEALNMYKNVLKKQKQKLGENHLHVLSTQTHMSLVLDKLQKYEEALKVNYETFEKFKVLLGENNSATLTVQNNIAMVLNNQGKCNEALNIYKNVYDSRKKILGPFHSDTLRTLHNIAGILAQKQNYDEALKTYQDVYDAQKSTLGPNHLDTLDSQNNIANVLFYQGKFLDAIEHYKVSFDRRKTILGSNHPDILNTLKMIEMVNLSLTFIGKDENKIL